jgi:hypothetical protein
MLIILWGAWQAVVGSQEPDVSLIDAEIGREVPFNPTAFPERVYGKNYLQINILEPKLSDDAPQPPAPADN